MEKKGVLPRGVTWIELPERKDVRGSLTFGEGGAEIPFEVARVFWITDVPVGQKRGGHAHWTCHEAVFAVAGSVEIELNDGERSVVVHLDSPQRGITIPAGVWCELRCFAPGTVCLVLASERYNAKGYVHDEEQWREEKLKH